METVDGFDVHDHRTETQLRMIGVRLRRHEVTFYRYVCECGRASHWSQDRDVARRALVKAHTVDGQLSAS